MANGRMTNSLLPTAADAPRIEVDFVEGGPTFGPGGGAKGIGELPMDGSAPAVANALEHALGVAVDEIPCLPETLMRLVRSAKR
jgi:CO/xanthine dehydrogenase Mo-binding subunit